MGVFNKKPKSKFLKQEVWKQTFEGITFGDPRYGTLQTLKPTFQVFLFVAVPLWKQTFDLFPFQTRNPNWESEYAFLYHSAFFWQSYNHIHFSPSPLGEGSNESYNQLASQAGMGVFNKKPKSKFLKQEVWKQTFEGITFGDPRYGTLQTLKPTFQVFLFVAVPLWKQAFNSYTYK